jgi:hypothetical protein
MWQAFREVPPPGVEPGFTAEEAALQPFLRCPRAGVLGGFAVLFGLEGLVEIRPDTAGYGGHWRVTAARSDHARGGPMVLSGPHGLCSDAGERGCRDDLLVGVDDA